MNKDELKQFMKNRPATEPDEKLVCYGCAHSASIAPYPSHPSGERPCCSCIRNPDRGSSPDDIEIEIGDDGHARLFDPWQGTMYNGAPRTHHPADNYVTMDHLDDDKFLSDHPEYSKSVSFGKYGQLHVNE